MGFYFNHPQLKNEQEPNNLYLKYQRLCEHLKDRPTSDASQKAFQRQKEALDAVFHYFGQDRKSAADVFKSLCNLEDKMQAYSESPSYESSVKRDFIKSAVSFSYNSQGKLTSDKVLKVLATDILTPEFNQKAQNSDAFYNNTDGTMYNKMSLHGLVIFVLASTDTPQADKVRRNIAEIVSAVTDKDYPKALDHLNEMKTTLGEMSNIQSAALRRRLYEEIKPLIRADLNSPLALEQDPGNHSFVEDHANLPDMNDVIAWVHHIALPERERPAEPRPEEFDIDMLQQDLDFNDAMLHEQVMLDLELMHLQEAPPLHHEAPHQRQQRPALAFEQVDNRNPANPRDRGAMGRAEAPDAPIVAPQRNAPRVGREPRNPDGQNLEINSLLAPRRDRRAHMSLDRGPEMS